MKLPAITAFCLIASLALGKESPEVSPTPAPTATPAASPSPTPDLDPAQVQKAIETLQTHFFSATLLDEAAKQRALLDGLLRRLTPGATIVATAAVPAKPVEPLPFLAEILDDRAGYIRPGALDAANLSQLDASLASFSQKKIPAIILDLRAIPRGGEFDAAADFARRFCPKGKLLFSIQKPGAKQERILTSHLDPEFKGVLVVLTDADCSGASEALAATLRSNANALVVGQKTSGEAVEFSEFPLGNGLSLRIAVSQAVVPGADPIFPGGVHPDISAGLSPEAQKEIFESSAKNGVSRFVFDPPRPRMNEAALVANTNPEIESTAPGQSDRARPPLRDSVLQRALDLVTAIGFYNRQP